MKHGSLFSGIGGFDLAAEWMGWENAFHCEWEEFPRKVLNYYWPNAKSYGDITKTDFTIHRGTIDILTGGFPCQPYSSAGKRLGKEDDRHLWPEMCRAIREIAPIWVVGENVRGLLNWNGGLVFDEVQADLEAEGYEVQPFLLPACGVNAPHRRDRIWFIAHRKDCGQQRPTQQEQEDRVGQRSFREHGQERSQVGGEHSRFGEPRPVADPGHAESSRSQQHKADNNRRGGEGFQEGDKPTSRAGNGPASNTNDPGTREPLRSDGNRPEDDQGRERLTQFKPGQGSYDAIDPDKQRREERTITHTESERHPTPEDRREGVDPQEEPDVYGRERNAGAGAWDEFPTQSPVCHGDDGISSRLDGIAFSKWRNESIKAGGNAIVPQVALQIFKAIQKYENYENATKV